MNTGTTITRTTDTITAESSITKTIVTIISSTITAIRGLFV